MAEFAAVVYQNEFLPEGGTDVNAIVTVTCTGAGAAGRTGSGDAGEIIIVDTSGSMGRTRMEAAFYILNQKRVHLRELDGLNTKLAEDDKVILMASAAGG